MEKLKNFDLETSRELFSGRYIHIHFGDNDFGTSLMDAMNHFLTILFEGGWRISKYRDQKTPEARVDILRGYFLECLVSMDYLNTYLSGESSRSGEKHRSYFQKITLSIKDNCPAMDDGGDVVFDTRTGYYWLQ